MLKVLDKARRFHRQKKTDKNKLYSLHKPSTQCIAKGKIGRKYEFGHKVSVAVCATINWVVVALGLKGNPFDGHTFQSTLDKVEETIKRPIKEVYVDRGYKGHGCDEKLVTINRERRGKFTKTIWKTLKHRSVIEPVIGYLKSDCRLERNYLAEEVGNAINALLSGAGYNFRKLLKGIMKLFVLIRIMLQGRMIAKSPTI